MENNKNKPPNLFLKFFRWFCHPKLKDHIEGDLLECYNEQVREKGKRKADLKFVIDVLLLFRPRIIKPMEGYKNLNQYDMFKNYFKIAWRTMSRQKMYSAIKIGGFAVGIAACLLIALLIRQELSYDRHYQNTDRIFRVYRESTLNGEFRKGVHFPAPFARALQEDFPEIESAGHLNAGEYFGAGNNELRRVDQTESLHEEGFIYADQNLISILEIPFIKGNPVSALL